MVDDEHFGFYLLHNMLKKLSLTLKTVLFLCKRLVLIGIQLIKEYKSIVNGLIKIISDKTSYKVHF